MATWGARQPLLAGSGLSALTLAICLGLVIGNTVYPRLAPACHGGVGLAKQRLLRAGIVLYGLRLTFQAVPGRVYHIEGNNNELPTASGWKFLGSVTNGGGNEAEWTDLSYPTNAIRHYRIKIPAFVP